MDCPKCGKSLSTSLTCCLYCEWTYDDGGTLKQQEVVLQRICTAQARLIKAYEALIPLSCLIPFMTKDNPLLTEVRRARTSLDALLGEKDV